MTNRKQLLTNAIAHTCGDRDQEYGSPRANLTDCATLWTYYLAGKYGQFSTILLTAEDVAHMNVLQKMARTFSGKVRDDTYEDMAAYAAIAGECAAPATVAVSGVTTWRAADSVYDECIYCGELVSKVDGAAHLNHDCPQKYKQVPKEGSTA